MSTFFLLLRSFGKRVRGGLCRAQNRGFTLIELLVVGLIIMLITAFVLFRQEGFNSSTLLRSLAYGVALTVRQAQVYGVSVRESAAGSGTFAPGYGVHFPNSTDCPVGSSDATYALFSDNDGNGAYTSSAERISCFKIGNGRGKDYFIQNFCAHVIGGSDQCSCTNSSWCTITTPSITSLTAYFRRPNPDACFSTSVNTGACATAATSPVYDYAYIQLRPYGGTDYRTIKITSTGQITVCQPNLTYAQIGTSC